MRFHSAAESIETNTDPDGLLETLGSWENNTLWRSLKIDGAGGWIRRGLMYDSLIVGHDGSYMPKMAKYVCSCAVVIY